MPLSTLQVTPRDVPCKTRGQDGFATSFPVGDLHPLQHAGSSRRSPVGRSERPQRARCRIELKALAVELDASHQTGWTGLIARTLDLFARLKPEDVLRASKGVLAEMTRQQVVGQRGE